MAASTSSSWGPDAVLDDGASGSMGGDLGGYYVFAGGLQSDEESDSRGGELLESVVPASSLASEAREAAWLSWDAVPGGGDQVSEEQVRAIVEPTACGWDCMPGDAGDAETTSAPVETDWADFDSLAVEGKEGQARGIELDDTKVALIKDLMGGLELDMTNAPAWARLPEEAWSASVAQSLAQMGALSLHASPSSP